MSVPPAAILGGLLLITSFIISPAMVTVPGTDWVKPALIWLTISMPTGSRKTTIYQFLRRLLQRIHHQTQCKGKYIFANVMQQPYLLTFLIIWLCVLLVTHLWYH